MRQAGRLVLAFTPEEQEEHAALGWVPVNIEMRPDPTNPNQMREYVFPGTWDNFTGIRYAGSDANELEFQLAQRFGLGVGVVAGHPTIRQFLLTRLLDEAPQQQRQNPRASGHLTSITQQSNQQCDVQQASQAHLTQRAPDLGNATMTAPTGVRPAWLGRTRLSRFVERWNQRLERRGGGVWG